MIHNFVSFSSDGTIITPPSNAPFGLSDNAGFVVDDPESPDFSYVSNIINEMFNRSAADVYLHQRTRNADINETQDEDPDPTYWPKLLTKAYFQPQPLEYELEKFGVVNKNQMEITFLRSSLLSEVGNRLVQIGDLIEVPYRSASEEKPRFYRVLNSQETGNYRYQWFYVTAQTQLLTGDVTVRPPADSGGAPINDLPLGM